MFSGQTDDGEAAWPATTWTSIAAAPAAPSSHRLQRAGQRSTDDHGADADEQGDAEAEQQLALPREEERQQARRAHQDALGPDHQAEPDDRAEDGDTQRPVTAGRQPPAVHEEARGRRADEQDEARVEQPRARRRHRVTHGDVCSSSTTTSLPGAGVSPTPNAKAPFSTWPSTAETDAPVDRVDAVVQGARGRHAKLAPARRDRLPARRRRGPSRRRESITPYQRELGVGVLREGEHDVPRGASGPTIPRPGLSSPGRRAPAAGAASGQGRRPRRATMQASPQQASATTKRRLHRLTTGRRR